ncbi:hypothetical protein GT034_36975, partial [Streptomyces sp. SID2563]|nr:hypothetical protein [Streptomyces sp. SID2563]
MTGPKTDPVAAPVTAPAAGPVTAPAAGPARRPVVGLDLGGTKIAAALFGADGTVLARHS